MTDVFDAIVAADKKYMASYNAGDTAGLGELYTENAQFMPPKSDFIIGKQAILETIQAFMDSGVKGVKLETIEVEGQGDTAFEVGRYVLEGEGGAMLDHGKYIVIWKQEAGEWKVHRDIINTSMPA